MFLKTAHQLVDYSRHLVAIQKARHTGRGGGESPIKVTKSDVSGRGCNKKVM